MNNTIVRRRADVCFLGNVIIEILTKEVFFNLNCSEQINGKHTILTICGIRIKLIIPDCHSGDAGGLPAYRSKNHFRGCSLLMASVQYTVRVSRQRGG